MHIYVLFVGICQDVNKFIIIVIAITSNAVKTSIYLVQNDQFVLARWPRSLPYSSDVSRC